MAKKRKKGLDRIRQILFLFAGILVLLVGGMELGKLAASRIEKETETGSEESRAESTETENSTETESSTDEANPYDLLTSAGVNGEYPVTEMYLTPNEYSRPQTPLTEVNNIVIHYVGNPNTEAVSNRNYFESLKDNHETKASSHFVVGLEGEIIQCIPLNEISYASNNRNKDTISIEVCHPEADGKFSPVTYQAVIALTAKLCNMYGLTEEDVIRHYDVTGKECPLYYVKNPEAWIQFKEDVKTELQKYTT